jgi:hypothetical protein
MARKEKPMTKEELRQPDEVEVKLNKFWEGLYKLRHYILGGVAVLVVIGGVLWFTGRSTASAKVALGDETAEALKAVGATTGEEPSWFAQLEKVPKPAHFADEKTRAEAATKGIDAFLAAHAGSPVAVPMGLTAANLKLRKGDAKAALADVEGWLTANADSPAVTLAEDLKARAHVAAGQLDEAEAAWTKAAEQVEGPLKAHFLTQIADLQNPSVHPGRGDAAKALATYKAALALLPEPPKPAEPTLFAMPQSGPRSAVQARIALLE